jgi:hypothetical protein
MRIVKALLIVGLVALYAGVCQVCPGQEADESLVLRAVGNMDLLKAEIGWRPGLTEDRTEVGLWGMWLDGIREDGEAGGFGVYGSYDLVKDAPLKIFEFQVPVTWQVGTAVGVLWPEAGADATANLFTGLNFGDGKIRLGIRAEYYLTKDLWRELADIPEDARLLATIEYRF